MAIHFRFLDLKKVLLHSNNINKRIKMQINEIFKNYKIRLIVLSSNYTTKICLFSRYLWGAPLHVPFSIRISWSFSIGMQPVWITTISVWHQVKEDHFPLQGQTIRGGWNPKQVELSSQVFKTHWRVWSFTFDMWTIDGTSSPC